MMQVRVVLLLWLLAGITCLGQESSGEIPASVQVSDPSGAPIPNAQVTIAPISFPKKLRTDAQGAITVALPAGSYEITASGQGFRTATKTLDVGAKAKNATVAMELKIGSCPPGTCLEVTGPSADEEAVWKLERTYWEYVQALDLEAYRGLWHPDFLGWPYVSPAPVRKQNITDWTTDYTIKGMHLASFDLRRAESRQNGSSIVTFYTITARWVDRAGRGEPSTSRVTHTWVKTGNTFQIISGMSASVDGAVH